MHREFSTTLFTLPFVVFKLVANLWVAADYTVLFLSNNEIIYYFQRKLRDIEYPTS